MGHVFIINLRGAASKGEDFVDGRRISFSPRRAGSLIYIPASSEWTGWDEGDATGSYLLVSVDQGFIQDGFEDRLRHRLPHLRPSIGFRDSATEMALQRMAAEIMQPDPLSVMMAESQAMQLLVQMTRLNGVPNETAKGGLSSFDLRHTVEMIETSAKAPTLPDLANEVGLSRFHYWRAFKQSMGVTPYAFMARRRLEKSSEMLLTTTLSATEIAMACNFSSSSHFSTAFKQAFGVTPTEYRRLYRF
ncbi:helix-turn-helix transcriptional regulator [Mesorhizobium retamae]|uniref:Helix-turn-helix transcriptional regulator n=1 Tax=Mesorhizobium retamae TaxID=2912854 RepID=A0ABS9QQ08_9HYPH|nr:AraC family transcriptional regulator [Mesorhizobium sp. IRAMC:0171]MCG7508634.1 helix-turn-helix transcriptional regulator [Mesorhizobium sp. IRAMC:0171]